MKFVMPKAAQRHAPPCSRRGDYLRNWFDRGVLAICAATLFFPVSGFAGTLALFRTPFGDIAVELFDQDKPVTVQNFIRYVESGAYTNHFFHRWVPGFVMQGGGFYLENRGATNATIKAVPSFGTITNEYAVGRTFSNVYGTIAMARVGGQTNSATSQWFFNLANNANLDGADGGFTVFGRVVGGTNVLNRFNNTTQTNGLYRANAGGPLAELPVLSSSPTVEDLFFARIELVRLGIQPQAAGGPLVFWNNLGTPASTLEFTTGWPANWQSLVTTNTRSARFEVTDTNAAGARFYRVRVTY